jgi:HEAT repeat protein
VKKIVLALLAALCLAGAKPAGPTLQQVRTLVTPLEQIDVAKLRELGPRVMPHLITIYRSSDEDTRAAIASVLYALGWKSKDARAALLDDIATSNQRLRLQVQWALGRVSDDTEVVDILAGIMRNDDNPLFRDKAACALAYDQIHLTERQKVALFARLIEGLSDEKPQVRAISIQALGIHTGQSKGFRPQAPLHERTRAVEAWKAWLAEYEKNL